MPFPLKLLATKAATLALRAWEEPLKILAHLQRFDYYSCPKSCGKSVIVSPLSYSNTSPQSLNSAVILHDYTLTLESQTLQSRNGSVGILTYLQLSWAKKEFLSLYKYHTDGFIWVQILQLRSRQQ